MWVAYTFMTLVIILAVAGLIGLLVKARTQWNKYWAAYLILTIVLGSGLIWLFQASPQTATVAAIPLFVVGILLAIVFGYRLSTTGPHPPTNIGSDEPLYTQEELRGREGTHEALRIYFLVLTLIFAAIALLSFLFSLTP